MARALNRYTERLVPASRPSARLVWLWLINAGTIAGASWDSPVLGALVFLATLCLVSSVVHWNYRRIMVPARRVADAFALDQGALGEACRDLSEAVLRYDMRGKA